MSLDRLLGRDTSPERELEFTLGDIYETTQRAHSQLTATENSLRALTDELTAFDFSQRDDLVALSRAACDALARANQELALLCLSPPFMGASQKKFMAETTAQLSRFPAVAQMLEKMTSDETQS